MRYAFPTFFILLCHTAFSQQQLIDTSRPEEVIKLVFEALSEANMSKMEQAVTPDIKILEHGVVWTLDTIRTYMAKKRPQDFRRVNSFEFFQRDVRDNMAFLSYHNRADIHANNKDRTIKWLESAVLVKVGQQWKVKMLHSTRLD